MKLNEELSYNEMCKELNIEPENKNISWHISALQKEYDIEVVSNHGKKNKYIIHGEYDAEMKAFIQSLNAPIQQLKFEAKLFEACLKSNTKALMVSNSQLLRLFAEVNDNFSYCFNAADIAKVDSDLCFFADMNKTVYKILYQWTMRKLDSMDKRMLFIKRRCFRLYKKVDIGESSIMQIVDVPINGDLEAKCQTIWNNELDKIDSKYKDDKDNLLWMPEGMWLAFERNVNNSVKAAFPDDNYVAIKKVLMLSPPSKDYMVQRLEHHYKEIGDLEEINRKAQHKILETRQLNNYTKQEREKYVEYNMTDNPPLWFREELINKE